MSQAERDRFHNLLLLAKETTFEGERRNALHAAERLAANFGLTLEEAARSGGEAYQATFERKADKAAPAKERKPESWRRGAAAEVMQNIEARFRNEKARFEEALSAARARGLDADEPKPSRPAPHVTLYPRKHPPGRPPLAHARVLLDDTQLPIKEIADISGLDVWTVAGLKLKLRSRNSQPS